MCIIVDINVFGKFINPANKDMKPLYDLFFSNRNTKQVSLSYGGKLLLEYKKSAVIVRHISILDRAGRAKKCDDASVDAETLAVTAGGQCVSDDEHIIALARIGGSRLLCTDDKLLQTDFKNPRLVSKPRGRVYTKATHINLVYQSCK